MKRPLCILAAVLIALSGPISVLAAPVEIASPADGATISGEGVDIIVLIDSSDKDTISTVEVYLDGELITKRSYDIPMSSGRSLFRWDTTRTPNGKHTLDIRAISKDGIVGSASCQLSVLNATPDMVAPKVSLASPAEGQIVSGIVPITVSASDDSGLEPFVNLYIDKTLKSVSNVAPYMYHWNTIGFENGAHYIDLEATDGSGNVARAKSVRVIVRNVVKQIPITEQQSPILPGLGEETRIISSTPVKGTVPTSDNASASVSESARAASSVKESLKVGRPTVNTSAPATDVLESIPAAANDAEMLEIGSTSTIASPEVMPEGKISSSETPEMLIEQPEGVALTNVSADSIPVTPSVAMTESPAKQEVSSGQWEVNIPNGVVSDLPESPVLMAKALESDMTLGIADADTMAVLPSNRSVQVEEVTVEAAAPVEAASEEIAITGCISDAAEHPVLMARLLESETDVSSYSISKSMPVCPSNKPIQVAQLPVEEQPVVETPKAKVSGNVLIREVFEGVGGSVYWNHMAKTVHAKGMGKDLWITVGSKDARLDGYELKMQNPPFIKDGRTIVAKLFVVDKLGMPIK